MATRNVLPVASVGVRQYFLKICILVAPIVVRRGENPAAPSSFDSPQIPLCIFLLYPHFIMILGNDSGSKLFTCLSVKKTFPRWYSTFGLYTPATALMLLVLSLLL